MPVTSLTSFANSVAQAASTQDGPSLARLFTLFDRKGPRGRENEGRLLHERKHHPADDINALLDWMARPERGNDWQNRTLHTAEPSYVHQLKRHFNKAAWKDTPWAEMATNHIWAAVALFPPVDVNTGQPYGSGDAIVAYQKQHALVTALHKHLIDARDQSTGWALPLLYVVCRELKQLGEQADMQLVRAGQKPSKLEEASRLLQKCFSACLNDRDGNIMAGRKMGVYYLAALLFKTYFRLNSTALCRNIIRGIGAADLPPLDRYPRAQQVTYRYYMGVFAFLREDYAEAEKQFVEALAATHRKVTRNIDLILDYLTPLSLLRGVFPSAVLLNRKHESSRQNRAYHRELYAPFAEAIKAGNVAAYDRQLERREKELMRRGTYLVVERAREGAVRGAFKKAWLLSGKPARMPLSTFRTFYNAAQKIGLDAEAREKADRADVDDEEVECMVANMVFKGLIKGYISHAHQLVVLSKEKPFPWYGPYRAKSPEATAARAAKEAAERARVIPAEEVVVPVQGQQ
ncbi:hypothetical protein JCM10207_005671 [Rhodosporidiobolus poonsookiae]